VAAEVVAIVAQVASPRQYVEDDALVPLFKLVTGKLPVTPVVRGKPVTLVITPDAGVPSAGVVNVGLVNVLLAVIDAVFILLRGIVFSQRNCDYLLFITSASV
jgi:hypothetical protein